MSNADPHGVAGALSLEGERALILRILAGERDEYRQLVEGCENQVAAMIFRQVGRHDITAELAQESFIRGYLNLKAFKFEARFSTWISRIALNLTSNYFASKRYKQERLTSTLDPTRHDRASEAAMTDDGLSEFRKALSELAPLHREVLVLCGIEGKSYEEAASLIGIPLGTVRSRLNKARLLLRDLMIAQRGVA